MPRLIVALRGRDGIVRSATCDLPNLEENFSGVFTVHIGHNYPSAVDVSPQRTKMERREGDRRTTVKIPLRT